MRNEGQTLNRIEVLGVKALRKPIYLLTLLSVQHLISPHNITTESQGRRYINVNTEKNQEYESPETLACKLIKTQELQYSMTTFDKRIMLPCLQENTGDIT